MISDFGDLKIEASLFFRALPKSYIDIRNNDDFEFMISDFGGLKIEASLFLEHFRNHISDIRNN